MGQDAMGNPAPVAWMGPGVDPDTGELVDDGSTYVVSSTYLALMPDPAAQQAFGESMGPIIPALLGNPGMIATSLGLSMQCSTARTLTVWASEEAMMAFVTSDAHATAIARVAEISRGDSLVTHWTGAAIPEITWDEALARVLADEGPFY
jgi:heme-degrading monooxygenase HmoA